MPAFLKGLRGSSLRRATIGSYIVATLAPLGVAASRHSFWEPEHSAAPAVSGLVVLVLAAFVIVRSRFAWRVLALAQTALLVSFAFAFTGVLPLLLSAASVALLFSPPVRQLPAPRGPRRPNRSRPQPSM